MAAINNDWQGGWVRGVYYGPDSPPPQDSDVLLVRSFKLHTSKGRAMLTLECEGDKTFSPGDVVSADDLAWSGDLKRTMRGEVVDVRVKFEDSKLLQTIEIAVHQHESIDNGEYKPKAAPVKKTSLAATTDNFVKAAQQAGASIGEIGQALAAMNIPYIQSTVGDAVRTDLIVDLSACTPFSFKQCSDAVSQLNTAALRELVPLVQSGQLTLVLAAAGQTPQTKPKPAASAGPEPIDLPTAANRRFHFGD